MLESRLLKLFFYLIKLTPKIMIGLCLILQLIN
jgi:hypothetical protein